MTTAVDIFGSSNSGCTVSTNEVCQFSLISCSPNCNEDHLCSKNDLFISESVHDESFQRSPSSFKTPSKEVSSPGSFELPSMPSDKSSSRDCSDGFSSVNCLISSDLTDTDRSNSACSLSPCPQSVGHCSNANDECSLLYSDRILESAFYKSVRTEACIDNCTTSHILHTSFTDTPLSQDPSFQTSYLINKSSAFTSFGCNNRDNFSLFQNKNYNKSYGSDFQHFCKTCIHSDKVATLNSSPSKDCLSRANHGFTEVIRCPAILDNATTYPINPTHCIKTSNSKVRFESQHSTSVYQSSQNTFNLQYRKTPASVSDASVPSNNRREFGYDGTEIQFLKVESTTVPSVCPLKEVDSSMSGIKPNIVGNKYSDGGFTCDPDSIFTGSEKISTTRSWGKTSLNIDSSSSDLANYIHVDPKHLPLNYNHDLHRTSVTPIAFRTNDDKNTVLLQNSIKNTSEKISSQNIDLRHRCKINVTNPTTKTDCSPVPECRNSVGSKCKRKGPKVSERSSKRHKSVDGKIPENVPTNPPADASIRSVFLQDVNRFLQDPPLHHSFDLYPPIPSPKLTQNRFSTNNTNDINTQGRKYFHFPLSLCKPENGPIPDDSILRFLARPDAEKKMDCLSHENFLLDAYKRTLNRNSCSTFVSPSPVNQLSPLDALTTHQPHSVYTNGCITPPLYPTLSDKPRCPGPGLVTNLNSHQKYCEEVILFDQLNGEAHAICSYCKMQIMLPQKTVKWKSQDKEGYLSFCSSSCLTRLKRERSNCMTSSASNASNFDNPLTITSTIESQPLIVFLVNSIHPKRVKQISKRLSQDLKSNYKRNTNDTFNRMSFGVISPVKRWCNIRWRRHSDVSQVCSFNLSRTSYDLRVSQKSLLPTTFPSNDTRECQLCHQIGDGSNDITSRLLNYNTDKWLHLNCILWCYETYETVSGSLMDVPCSSKKASETLCTHCKNLGAGLPCFDSDCQAVYHLPCAHQINCSFHPDRGMYCPLHRKSSNNIPQLASLAVERKVYIFRDEHSQVEKIISDEDHLSSTQNVKEPKLKLRIGTLILHRIGQLLPEQLASGVFHTSNFIYPVGYWTSRIYWSFRHVGQRCRYDCRIEDAAQPDDIDQSLVNHMLVKFTVEVIEPNEEKILFEDSTCDGVWQKIINRINLSRKCSSLFFRILQDNIRGEVLYGLTEPHIIRAIESLPGVDRLSNYLFKFGKLQLIQEMPLAINPTGSARSEPKLRTYIRRKSIEDINICPYIAHNHVILETPGHSYSSDIGSPTYLNSQSPSTTSKSQQYRRLRWDWKTNVVLARSRIQGLGLYAARDISKSTFIIEYLGEVIRNEVANRRERLYESQNRGIYMFRVDDDWIVDATMSGGLARYINHSCDPNCTAEILHCDNSNHIVIIANKNIEKGDELTYDYKFDLEEDRWDRIPCLCGSVNCRKWMN